MRPWLLLVLLLGGCRYTFLPLVPPEAPTPDLVVVEARLEAKANAVRVILRVHRLPEAGYLTLRWYRGRTLLWEGARFVEGPTELKLRLPTPGPGPYRIEILWRGKRVLVQPLGFPSPPKAEPPEWKGS